MSVLLTEQEVAEISVECALQSPCDLLFAKAIQIALLENLRKEPDAIADGTFNHNCGLGEYLYRLPTPEELENEK